jgi:hypothetical protein
LDFATPLAFRGAIDEAGDVAGVGNLEFVGKH